MAELRMYLSNDLHQFVFYVLVFFINFLSHRMLFIDSLENIPAMEMYWK